MSEPAAPPTGAPVFYGQLNSVQFNIATFVNVARAMATRSLDGNVFMRDNSVASINQGTNCLMTTCKQGQVLNWLVFALNTQQLPDKTWPPMPQINTIVFLNRDRSNVAEHLVCTQFGVYGGPDKMRSPYTPVYYYWAGTVIPTLTPGIYPYRLVIEMPAGQAGSLHLNLDGPSLKVIPMHAGEIAEP